MVKLNEHGFIDYIQLPKLFGVITSVIVFIIVD